ncbi:DEAD/DEAH box helicase domain-containing protein [Ditylenchus destructor]|nr:DEAD/DEAH box helicase domain-containing protein [Ditylenchus destructor]
MDDKISKLLCPEVKNYFFDTLKHAHFTPVQRCTIEYMLQNYDCVVQAPTGSGKTLAYLIPTLQLLMQKKKRNENANESNSSCEIIALIVAPSKELVSQIGLLAKPLCETLGFNLLCLFGGAKKSPEKMLKGQCVLIATPGRMDNLISKIHDFRTYLKALEVLIIDEADKFSDVEFQKNMTALLSALPKQRRTGLFSATQAKEVEEILKFGLRNPIRLTVTNEKRTSIENDISAASKTNNTLVTPKELINCYSVMDADKKLLALIEFLKEHISHAKILLFLCSAAEVEYFASIFPALLDNKNGKILALHGKKKSKRQRIVDEFRKSKECLLLSTDVLARGLDILDIDWVLQYDIPRKSSMFIHRSGRSARNGKIGHSLLFLSKEESPYIEFVQNYEKVDLCEFDIPGITNDNAVALRERVQQLAINDRDILEKGSRAFISTIQAYTRHDCQIVCRLKDLDVSGIANSFGLIRLPILPEFRGLDLRSFEGRRDVKTSTIAFLNVEREAKRQQMKENPKQQSKDIQNPNKAEKAEEEFGEKRKRKVKTTEWEELQNEQRLLKKFKKGKISKEELDELL